MSWRTIESTPLTLTAPETRLEGTEEARTIELTNDEKKRIRKFGKFITNFEKVTEKVIRKFERKERQRPKKVVALLLGILALNGYMGDVHENQASEQGVEVTLKTIQDLDLDSSAYFADGLYSLDADFLTETLGSSVQQVRKTNLVSINVGNAPPGPDEVATEVIEDVDENDITRVSLFGYSVGGVEVTEAAPKIISESEASIEFIYLASTPSGVDTLRPEKQFLINALTQALSFIPFSESSTHVQKGVAFLFQANNYMPDGNLLHIDFSAIPKSLENANREVTANERPGVSTLEYQVKLAKSNIGENIRKIAEASKAANKIVPTLVYLLVEDDDTVDNQKALATIREAGDQYGVPVRVVVVQSDHSRYYTDSSKASYSENLLDKKDELLTSLYTQEEIHEIGNWATVPKNSPSVQAVVDDPLVQRLKEVH